MGWLKFDSGEKSDGSTGKVSNVKVNVKTNKSGRVTDVLVSSSGNKHKNHDHYFEKSSGWWGKSSKNK